MGDEKNYTLGYDDKETSRLDTQHELIRAHMGYFVHPAIKLKNKKDVRIVDIGTGTAAWPCSVAAEVSPDVELHGFDVSDQGYPAASEMPSNIHLHVHDFKKPFEQKWQGYFDFVHCRMLTAAILPNEWEGVLRNVMTLLKPDGVLQWEEWNLPGVVQILRGNVEPDNPKFLRAMENTPAQWLGGQTMTMVSQGGYNTLQQHLDAVGYSKVIVDHCSIDRLPELRKKWSLNIMNVFETMGRVTIALKPGSTTEDAFKQVAIWREAVEAGCYVQMNMHCFVVWP